MLNHIVLMGRLTRDPELRYTGSNVPVASFSIAVDRDFGRGENGEKRPISSTCPPGVRPGNSSPSTSRRAA